MKIGLMLPQTEGLRGHGMPRWSDIVALARRAEAVGFDSLWLVDHFLYRLEGEARPRGVWECWSLLSALAASTATVELGTLVIGLGFRNPTLLAKMADTVEEISAGRLILGVGAGYHRYEYDAFGYPYSDRFKRFAEAIQILHGLLRHGHVDFDGRFHSARNCELVPRGPRPHGPPLMIGSTGEKMLRLAARYADAWNAYYDDTGNSHENLARLRRLVDAACREEGREPATLARSATVLVAAADADPWWTRLPTGQDVAVLRPVAGSAAEIAAALIAYRAAGIAHLQVCLEPTTLDTIERFAEVLAVLGATA